VVGFADDPVADSKAAASRGRAFHAAGAEAGRLAYATRVIGQRQGSASQLAQADELDDLVDELQSLMPSDCSPLATTSVGATKSLTGATGTLTAGRTALADRLLTAASSMPGGASRQSLARLWWQLR
jgi:hypothetical protein